MACYVLYARFESFDCYILEQEVKTALACFVRIA